MYNTIKGRFVILVQNSWIQITQWESFYLFTQYLNAPTLNLYSFAGFDSDETSAQQENVSYLYKMQHINVLTSRK